MTQVKWTGSWDPRDSRVLASEDLQKLDVSGFRKTIFFGGVPTEVDESVADTLVANPDFFGPFEVVDETAAADDDVDNGDEDPDLGGFDQQLDIPPGTP